MAEARGEVIKDVVEPAAAREYIAKFHPDPKAVDTLPETDVLQYHERVRGLVDTSVQDAIKARGEFGPDWRKSLAGENGDDLKTLERLQSPKAVWDSYKALRTQVSSGELKKISPYPANGTPEQQDAWRADAGIPGKPEEYKVEPPAGLVLGEEDKPFIDNWLKTAHSKNLSQEAVNAGVAYWAEQRMERQEQQAQQQVELKKQTEDAMRSEWGAEYRPSMSRIEGLLEANLPPGTELKEVLMNSVATSADFARFMGQVAFQLNPAGTSVPMGQEGQIGSISDWLTKADTMMVKDRRGYDKSEFSRDYQKDARAYQSQTGKEWRRK